MRYFISKTVHHLLTKSTKRLHYFKEAWGFLEKNMRMSDRYIRLNIDYINQTYLVRYGVIPQSIFDKPPRHFHIDVFDLAMNPRYVSLIPPEILNGTYDHSIKYCSFKSEYRPGRRYLPVKSETSSVDNSDIYTGGSRIKLRSRTNIAPVVPPPAPVVLPPAPVVPPRIMPYPAVNTLPNIPPPTVQLPMLPILPSSVISVGPVGHMGLIPVMLNNDMINQNQPTESTTPESTTSAIPTIQNTQEDLHPEDEYSYPPGYDLFGEFVGTNNVNSEAKTNNDTEKETTETTRLLQDSSTEQLTDEQSSLLTRLSNTISKLFWN